MRRRTVVLCALGLLAACAAALEFRPIQLVPVEAELAAPRPTASTAGGAGVVLIADPDAVAARWSERFEECDWAFGWASWIEQEFGQWTLCAPGALGIAEAAIVVVPEYAWQDLDATDRAELQQRIAGGGLVIAEAPPADIEVTATGWIVVEPGFAASIVRAQQGWWAPGADVPPHVGVEPGLLQPQSLLEPGAPELTYEPTVDVRERALRRRVDGLRPVPGFWAHPDAAPAFVAVTVDEENFGDRSAWIARAFTDQEVASTTFVIPDAMTAAGVTALAEAGSVQQLHWNRGFFHVAPIERWGIGPYHPIERRLSLVEQRDALRTLGGCDGELLMNRNHGLVWDPEFGRTFRMLHAAGIEVDSTYGPTGEGVLGYVFGTGLPYRPLDAGGWPFPMLEIPFQYQDDEEFSRAAQSRLIDEAATLYHTVVVPTFHTNTMSRVPSAEAIEGTREIGAVARDAGAAVGSLDEYAEFWRDRLLSSVDAVMDGDDLTIACRAIGPRQSIRVPFESNGRRAGAIIGDIETDAVAAPRRIGSDVVIPVPPGKSTWLIEYR